PALADQFEQIVDRGGCGDMCRGPLGRARGVSRTPGRGRHGAGYRYYNSALGKKRGGSENVGFGGESSQVNALNYFLGNPNTKNSNNCADCSDPVFDREGIGFS